MNGPTIVARAAFGVNPASMKKAVKMPHAISAGMFGMIMPERNVPKRWTWTCAFLAPETGTDAVVMSLSPSVGSRSVCRDSAVLRCGHSCRLSGGCRVARGERSTGDDSGIVEGVLQQGRPHVGERGRSHRQARGAEPHEDDGEEWVGGGLAADADGFAVH